MKSRWWRRGQNTLRRTLISTFSSRGSAPPKFAVIRVVSSPTSANHTRVVHSRSGTITSVWVQSSIAVSRPMGEDTSSRDPASYRLRPFR
jgi:hypothetical protein